MGARTMGFWGDDWLLLDQSHCLACVFQLQVGYHYNPIAVAFRRGLFALLGTNTVAFHVVVLALFWVCAVLVIYIGWRLTGDVRIGVVAGLLFAGYGTQYEAAIWSAVAVQQNLAFIVYLAGLLCYRAAHDQAVGRIRRSWAYTGFVLAVAAGPFTYEPNVTLLVACALYRLWVLDRWRPFTRAHLRQFTVAWVRDFALPAALIVAYLGFKLWFGRAVGFAQTPGLAHSPLSIASELERGILQALVPGLGVNQLTALQFFNLWFYFFLVLLALEVVLLVLVCRLGGPVVRFLVCWAMVMVVAQVLGLGRIQSRHLLQITVPGAIHWSCLIVALADAIGSGIRRATARAFSAARGPHLVEAASGAAARVARWGCIALLVGSFVLVGWRCASSELDAWGAASVRVNAVLAQVTGYAASDPTATTIYVVDLPDSTRSSLGDLVYLFRNAQISAFHLTLPHRFRKIVVAHTQKVVPVVKSYDVFATAAQLARWAAQPGALVLRYDITSGQLVRVQPGSSTTP